MKAFYSIIAVLIVNCTDFKAATKFYSLLIIICPYSKSRFFEVYFRAVGFTEVQNKIQCIFASKTECAFYFWHRVIIFIIKHIHIPC